MSTFTRLLAAASILLGGVSANFLWTEANCAADVGNVTDSLCCGAETFCRSLTTESDCVSDLNDAAIYCQWTNRDGGKCVPVADRRSNVCCRGQELNSCASIFAGLCPEEFQVKKDCCSGDDALTKFSFLKTANDDELVCCNAPCAAMEKANCPLTDKCAPTKRSWVMGHPYQALGFYHDYGYPIDHRFGTILHGTGFGRDYPRRRRKYPKRGRSDYDDKDYDYSKDDHVDEVTVDDLFLMMIDSMEKEADVKIYDADVTSDPYLGKTKSGGLFVDHNLPDPHKILDEIYGRPGYYDHYRFPFFGFVRPGIHHYPMYQPLHPMYPPHPMHQSYPNHQSYPTPYRGTDYQIPHGYQSQSQGYSLPNSYDLVGGRYDVYEPYSHYENSYEEDLPNKTW